MKSAVELLEAYRESLESQLRQLLLEYSGLEEREMSGPDFVVIGKDHSWTPLDPPRASRPGQAPY